MLLAHFEIPSYNWIMVVFTFIFIKMNIITIVNKVTSLWSFISVNAVIKKLNRRLYYEKNFSFNINQFKHLPNFQRTYLTDIFVGKNHLSHD